MDVHRSRFVPYPSPPINAIAFSRPNDQGLDGPKPALKLAIGRANGDIEIWNPNAGTAWVQEAVFHGDQGSSIDGLVWTQDPDELGPDDRVTAGQLRLFSIASTAAVTEWNLSTGSPLRQSTGNFGEVWCLAAQPRQVVSSKQLAVGDTDYNPSYQEIVIGCGDGTLALLSTADNDLEFKRFMARSGSKKTRCMSVIWQNRHRVVAGFNDSTIRICDARNGTIIRNISTGAGIPGAPKDTLVWRIKCLPNGDIVSADSNGEVRFWDGKNYSLLQRIAGHTSDCLELVTSADGQTVFSGGMDGRIATYKYTGGDRKHWAKIAHRRLHKGDIKSMAVYDDKAVSVVVSGGHDASPTFIPFRNFGREPHRRVSGLGQTPPCLSVPAHRLLICWWDQTVYIWRIAKQQTSSLADSTDGQPSRQLVSRIILAGDQAITSAAVSSNGRLLVVGTRNATKAFALSPSKDQNEARLRVHTVELPSDLADLGSKLLNLSADDRWLSVVGFDNEVHVARLVNDSTNKSHPQVMSKTVELDRANHKYSRTSGLGAYEAGIVRAEFSPGSDVLVVGDVSGYLDTWVLEGHYDSTAPAMDTTVHDSDKSDSSSSATDSDSDSSSDSDSDHEDENVIFHGQHWSSAPSKLQLPHLDSAPLILTFRPRTRPHSDIVQDGTPGLHPNRHGPHAHSHSLPSTPAHLLIITQTHRVYEFDVLKGGLTDWSRRNPTSCLPSGFAIIQDRAKGVMWETRSGQPGAGTGTTADASTTSHAKKSSTHVAEQESEQYHRLWLYGASWLAMLDVSQDFAPRKEVEQELAARREAGLAASNGLTGLKRSAAGESFLGNSGRARKRRRAEAAAASAAASGLTTMANGTATLSNKPDDDDLHEDPDARDVEDQDLAVQNGTDVRSSSSSEDEYDNDDDDDDDLQLDRPNGQNKSIEAYKKTKRTKWWVTFRYKPILGAVSLTPSGSSSESKSGSTSSVPMEVALVERPDWDLVQIKSLEEE